MKKYLYNYIENIDSKIRENNISEKIKKEHLVKINFFQHERLIHLIVTISFAILTLISVIISKYYCSFIFITIILLICLVFYILHYYYLEVHYFRLENGVQYLYKQYDKMFEK